MHALHGVAALRAVRPDAHLGFLVEDRAAALVVDHPDLDRVHVYPRRAWRRRLCADPVGVAREAGAFVSGLRGERYDVAVDFQGNLKGGLLSRLSGAPRRIGLARGHGREANHLFQTERVTPPAYDPHRVDRVLALLEPLGVESPRTGGSPGARRIAIPDEDREAADRFLREAGLATGDYAVFHPGTSAFGLYKRWPAERYGALAAALLAARGLRSVVTWGPGERNLAETAVRASGGAAVPGPEPTSLAAVARLAERAALFVAGDTGVMHLAAFLGTPTVGLFGPKDPAVYGPRGTSVAVVHKGLDCTGCPKRTCPDPVCMTSITIEEVLESALRLLGGRFALEAAALDGSGARRRS